MSDAHFELEAMPRSDVGKGASRRLRRLEDMVPAIIYGGTDKPENLMIEHRLVIKALEFEAFYSHILTLSVAGKPHKVVLKDVQRHPFKPRIMHLDFLRVNEKDSITMHVPIHFIGEETCAGLKEGGIVNKQLTDLEIRCLPGQLPEFISVDITNLKLDEGVHLSDLKLPKGVEITALAHGHDLSVVSVHAPRVQEEAPAPEEAEGSTTDSGSKSSKSSASSSSTAPSEKGKK